MNVPPEVQELIEQELAVLQRAPEQALLPYRRLQLYAAFGPTYHSATFTERIDMIRAGQLPLTLADRVRTRLAILTAQHVLPFWFSALDDTNYVTPESITSEVHYFLGEYVNQPLDAGVQARLAPTLERTPLDFQQLRDQIEGFGAGEIDDSVRSILLTYVSIGLLTSTDPRALGAQFILDPRIVGSWPFFTVPTVVTPLYMLQLATHVLDGSIEPRLVLDQMDDMHTALGNSLGFDELEGPMRAVFVCDAAYEALNQSLGLGPFDFVEITPTTTDEDLAGRGAAAAAALQAYAGIYVGHVPVGYEFDPVLRRAFWTWWLTEAIPRAWAAEDEPAGAAAADTMPFEQTVRVTAHPVGIVSLSEPGTAAGALPDIAAVFDRPPTLLIMPGAGPADQVFNVIGAGFPAGSRLAVRFRAPDGGAITLMRDGQPVEVTVDADGMFQFDLLPARDVPNPGPGRLTMQVCRVDDQECWPIILNIRPAS